MAVFVIIFGFVTAALIASASAAYQRNDGSLVFSTETTVDTAKAFLLCMFVGPYLIAKNSLLLWVDSKLSFYGLLGCLLVAMIWSFCLGIVSVQALVGLGIF